ncbi:MAG: response regulator [Verrucomicrobia bacterium]|nr:response regulator [Verrucomicrobiota bacterium]
MQTLLVVDDNPAIRATLDLWFTRQKFVVLMAENEAEALEQAQRHPIDAALIDLRLANQNGADVCRSLQSLARDRGHAPLVWLMSGFYQPEDERRARAAGAVAIVPKPFHFDQLTQEILTRLGQNGETDNGT